MRHYQQTAGLSAAPSDVFDHLDNHAMLSEHMTKRSWMMGGGKMSVWTDGGGGKRAGSHIRMQGRVLGVALSLDEVVTTHEPPRRKVWETVGNPRLLVIGHYRLGFQIQPQPQGSVLTVFIDYHLPGEHAWLGRLFGGLYARWCVRQMLRSAVRHFALLAPRVRAA
jgi:hypothetical protein